MSTAPLPKEIIHRINKDSDAWVNPRSTCAGAMQSSYIEGATIEATRALLLIEALEQFIKHHESGILPNRLAYDFAKLKLQQYNQQP